MQNDIMYLSSIENFAILTACYIINLISNNDGIYIYNYFIYEILNKFKPDVIVINFISFFCLDYYMLYSSIWTPKVESCHFLLYDEYCKESIVLSLLIIDQY